MKQKILGIRENDYLQKYLPVLNSAFSSNFSETAIFETLTTKLKFLKLSNTNTSDNSSYSGVSLLVYRLDNTQIDPTFVKFSILNKPFPPAKQGGGSKRQELLIKL